jgi:hypothetical protein
MMKARASPSICSSAFNATQPKRGGSSDAAIIGERTLEGLSTITPEQLELFDTLDLPDPRSVVTQWRIPT